jgi:hypothetical protein
MRYYAKPSILECPDPGQLAWNAIEPIWNDLPLSTFSNLARFMRELSKGQQGLIALDWCQKEIRNGGLEQLFSNPTGNLVPWGLEGFKMIGAYKYGVIVAEAAALLGHEYPRSAAARKRVLRGFTKDQKATVSSLDDAFLELIIREGAAFEERRAAYVRSYPGEFVLKGGLNG